ncbi:hypothetical protein JCM9140_1329 [Halalkalibacter wakoensis JCM 9140]|uniref:EamA domain-containing protein n=1 Tax=Halalkalibacter wakoensis JCM 9140 TaxID=1236970 RepID=W4Q1T3_9BACI|nr:EamA family transporter [Halalkalibacter wakoensis]GAE25339.1 hypothetical protein JCM9140_1329 [Halalkalibacter wakoensis JCM 9140]
MTQKVALLSIGAAAFLWGIIGIFVTYLYEMGFTPTQVVTVRALSASLFLVLYILIKNRNYLKIKVADSKYFVGTGVISFLFFNWCLFSAIDQMSISVAAILLYTAPAFVTIFSWLMFKEALTKRKITALLVTLIGSSFVVGILPSLNESISLVGLVLGVGSGFFYGLYSIFGKFALQKYHPLTVTVYTFLFAAVAITPFSGLWNVLSLFSNLYVWIFIIGLGFLSTMLPFLLYTKGLSTIESSKASIIATMEPVVASLVGFAIFHETLTFYQYVGIILVIAAVLIVQETAKTTSKQPIIRDKASV